VKISNLILLAFVCSACINCSDSHLEYDVPYFQFKNQDTPNLLKLPELNARFTFVNQKNEKLYFDVVKSAS
jgi:hypothetical protein